MLLCVDALKRRIADSLTAFKDVFRNENLRRLELAWAASIVGNWAFLVAVSVYAYGVGGDAAVGLILLLRLVPAALIAPFAGLLADRYRRERVLLITNLLRIVLISAAAVCVFLDAPPAVVYGLAVAAAIVTTPFRSAQAALTPSLARSPSELTAANAVASTVESLAAFAGPAIAGLLLVVAGTATVFALTAGLVAVSTLFVLRIRAPEFKRRGQLEASTIASEALVGFRTVAGEPTLRVLVGLFTAQTFVAGAALVYLVVLAIQVLDLGDAGVGYLNSALGIGALIGGVLAFSLTGARRLSPAFLLGVVLWGVPLILLGIWQSIAPALLLFAVLGVGNSLVDVAAFTLVQRAVPDEILARVFGVIQMLWLGSAGIGAAAAPLLINWLGFDEALIVTGALLPALVLLFWRKVARIDAAAVPPDPDELRILGSVPIFAPLPGMTLEHIAGRLVPLRLEPGTVVVRKGDPGDRFFIVADGTVEVSEYGRAICRARRRAATSARSPLFATWHARRPSQRSPRRSSYALDRDDFLAAVTNHAPSAEAAEEVVSSRLAGIPVAGARPPLG